MGGPTFYRVKEGDGQYDTVFLKLSADGNLADLWSAYRIAVAKFKPADVWNAVITMQVSSSCIRLACVLLMCMLGVVFACVCVFLHRKPFGF